MTEKRFTTFVENGSVCLNDALKVYKRVDVHYYEYLLKCMNELNNENEQLREENEGLKSTNMEMEDYLGRLEEEKIKLEICLRRDNEQLKKEIKYLQSELHNATYDVRKMTLKEVKDEIEKLERWE